MRVWVAGMAFLGAACGAVSAGDAVECASDAECATAAYARCGSKGICEPSCGSSTECASDSVCTAGGCVALRSASTVDSVGTTVLGDCFGVLDGRTIPDINGVADLPYDAGADPIVVGVMGDFVDGRGQYFVDSIALDGVAMALNHLRGALFPGARRVVALVCSQEHAEAAARHLVSVGAKAIIGPTTEMAARSVLPVAAAAKIPVVSSWLLGRNAADGIDMKGLLWLPAPEREAILLPLQAKLAEAEAAFVSEHASAPRKMRVATLLDEASTTLEFSRYREILGALTFNGAPTASNENDATCTNESSTGCYRTISTALDPSNPRAGYKTSLAIANEIAAFAPDVIIPFADVTTIASVPGQVETISYAGKEPKPRWIVPFQLTEYGSFKQISTYVKTTDPKDPPRAIPDEALARVSGFRTFRSPREYERFLVSLAEFAPSRVTSADNAGPIARSYEDTSLVFHAAYKAALDAKASGRTDFTAEELAAAIPKVTERGAVHVSSTRVDATGGVGANALLAGKHIRLTGVLSAFDFDPVTGTVPGSWEAWQIASTGSIPIATYTYASTGACYEPTSARFVDGSCTDAQ